MPRPYRRKGTGLSGEGSEKVDGGAGDKRVPYLDFSFEDAETAGEVMRKNAKGFIAACIKRARQGDIELTKVLIPRFLPNADKEVGEDAKLVEMFQSNDLQELKRYASGK